MRNTLALNSTNPVGIESSFQQGIRSKTAAFEKLVHRIESLEIPLTFTETGLEWGGLVQSIEYYSNTSLHFLTNIVQPCQIITLINDVKKVAQMTFGSVVEGKEWTGKPAELTALGFSMVTRCCKTLTWLQNLGLITPAVAAAWRISFIGTFCSLMSASVELGDNVIHYSSAQKLVKAFLNFTAAAIAVYLLFQVSVQLHILFLMLTTGTLLLSVVTAAH